MERLTQRLRTGEVLMASDYEEKYTEKEWSDLCTIIGECGGIDRLRTLAEADKDGRLVVLPCKPGDTVYSIFGAEVIEKTVGRVIINGYTTPRIWVDLDCSFLSSVTMRWDLGIGKDFFLTREEAEKALVDKREELKTAYDSISQLDGANSSLMAANEKLAADRKALINELCQYCGKYKKAHEGACDGCRWRDM